MLKASMKSRQKEGAAKHPLFSSLKRLCFVVLMLGLAVTNASHTWAQTALEKDIKASESLKLLIDVETPTNDQSHLWNWITSIAIDERGERLALFNLKPPRVSILSTTDFRLLTSFGREGRGPGEFLVEKAWIGMRNDKLYVMQGIRTSLFSLDGKYLDKDLAERRTAMGAFLINWTSGVDSIGRIYDWDSNTNASHLVRRRSSDGNVEQILEKTKLSLRLDSYQKLAVRFGVLADGSVVAAFAYEPIILKTDSKGDVQWSFNVVEHLGFLKSEYEDVAKGKIQFPLTAFWTDEKYTILTYVNSNRRVGESRILFVFLDTKTGNVLKISYPRELIRKKGPSEEDNLNDNSLAFVPMEIAHHDGYLYVFAVNSARVQKYKLMWYK